MTLLRPAPWMPGLWVPPALRRTPRLPVRERAWIAAAAARAVAASVVEPGEWRAERIVRTGTLVTVVQVGCGTTGRRFVVKMPADPRREASLRRQAEVLARMRADPRLAGWLGPVPRCVGHGRVEGILYWVEEAVPGRPVTGRMLRGPQGPATLRFAREFATGLHARSAVPVTVDEQAVERWVHVPVRHISGYLAQGRGGTDQRAALDRLAAELAAVLLGRDQMICRIHGDFWPGNLLCTGSLVTGVVDWDRAEPDQLPLHDLLHLHVMARRLTGGFEMGDVVVNALRHDPARAIGVPDEELTSWLYGLPPRAALILYWLRHVWLHIGSEGTHDGSSWIRRNARRVLANI